MPIIGTCCCQPPGVECCPPGCIPLVNFPRRWSFSIAGIAPGTCTQCNDYNGNFTVESNGNCIYYDNRAAPPGCTENQPDPVCRNGYTWRLASFDNEFPNHYILQPNYGASDTGLPKYGILRDQWNCNGLNTLLILLPGGGQCLTFPPQVTLTPQAVQMQDCGCDNALFEAFANQFIARFPANVACCGGALLGEKTMTYVRGGICAWRAPNTPCFDTEILTISMFMESTARKIWLIGRGFPSTSEFLYAIPVLNFNPVGPNTLTRQFPSGGLDCFFGISSPPCANLPATLLVEPV